MNQKEYNISVDLYADSIYRFVVKNLKDSEKSKDIIQDVFEKVWKKVENIEYKKIKSYLFTSAYHTMLDYIKKDKKMTSLEGNNFPEKGYTKEYSGLNEVLETALDRLPEIQKSVILLRDYEGYSYQEIGEITDLKEAQVKVYIYRARKALQKYLVSIENVI